MDRRESYVDGKLPSLLGNQTPNMINAAPNFGQNDDLESLKIPLGATNEEVIRSIVNTPHTQTQVNQNNMQKLAPPSDFNLPQAKQFQQLP
jgi:hypothetical protein